MLIVAAVPDVLAVSVMMALDEAPEMESVPLTVWVVELGRVSAHAAAFERVKLLKVFDPEVTATVPLPEKTTLLKVSPPPPNPAPAPVKVIVDVPALKVSPVVVLEFHALVEV